MAGVPTTAPERLADGDTHLRRFTVDDAATLATAVRESLDHLGVWMPWADDASTQVPFQHQRLVDTVRGYDDPRGSWEYAICEADGTVVGSCGIAVRVDGRREIGYWLHVDHAGKGHGTRAARLLTDLWREQRDEPRIEIRCDVANAASAAIPKKLGYTLEAVIDGPREARGETGRTMVWVMER
jgi:RimJ/RimL family protein N-acetyltransferase